MKKIKFIGASIFNVTLLSACGESMEETPAANVVADQTLAATASEMTDVVASIECNAETNISYLCGPRNAEDILRIGDSEWLLVSGMNGDLSGDGINGTLHLVNHEDKSFEVLFPGDNPVLEFNSDMYPGCPGPLDVSNISVHGLDMLAMSSGPQQYKVFMTSHGAREAIEVFEMDAFLKPTIKWVGCIPMPTTSWTNSVTMLADGGFYATQFMDPTGSGMGGVSAGEITGHVFEWHPGEEVSVAAGTDLSGPNGITISDDERWLYVAAFGTHEVVRFDTSVSPMTKESVSINVAPDNIRWNTDGTLYTAGGYVTEDCPGPECGIGWGVVEIDPDTFTASDVNGVDGSVTMQGASSAYLVGDEIWIGTYAGDRIGILAKP